MIFFIIAFGAIIGSFLNVCIFRLPENRSLIHPGSSCPYCGARIRFYDNIPIISYLILLGKCRRCGRRISLVYPLVESLMAFFAFLLYLKFGLSASSGIFFVFIAALVVTSFIDFKHYIIPDSISLSGIILGFLFSFVPGHMVSPVESFLGVIVGGGLLLLVGLAYEKLTSREGIGGGDIKLLAMMGAFMGYKSVLLIILLSSIVGSIVGIFLIIFLREKNRYSVIPFGPFLSLGAIISVYCGNELISLYLNLFYV